MDDDIAHLQTDTGDPGVDAILPALRSLVEAASRAPECRLAPGFFREHVLVVERFVRRLAPLFGADPAVVVPAAILHDIAATEDFTRVAEHHELGAERAAGILRAHGLDEGRIGRIASCIRAHVRPVAISCGPEEACLSHADALAQMANPSYWLDYARVTRSLAFPHGRDWYAGMVGDRWEALSEDVRDMARPHYMRAVGACMDDLGELPPLLPSRGN